MPLNTNKAWSTFCIQQPFDLCSRIPCFRPFTIASRVLLRPQLTSAQHSEVILGVPHFKDV